MKSLLLVVPLTVLVSCGTDNRDLKCSLNETSQAAVVAEVPLPVCGEVLDLQQQLVEDQRVGCQIESQSKRFRMVVEAFRNDNSSTSSSTTSTTTDPLTLKWTLTRTSTGKIISSKQTTGTELLVLKESFQVDQDGVSGDSVTGEIISLDADCSLKRAKAP